MSNRNSEATVEPQSTAKNGLQGEILANVQDLLSSLSSRPVRLREWIQKAWAYYNQSHFEDFVLLLENAILRGTKAYAGYKDDLLKAYTMLAAHFVHLACSDPGATRQAWKEKVMHMLLAIDNIQLVSNETQNLLCRSFALLLLETRVPEADNNFVAVLRQLPHSIPALLGRGCVAYYRHEYRVAMGYFKSVLVHQPQGPADVRVGIAHCFLKLGDLASARRAFELALAQNGRCLNALLGMAQLKLNERQRHENLEAMNLLCAAFELNNHHPLVLSWLSGYFYYTRNYEKLQLTAGNAYLNTDNPQLKAQNCFQIARSFHAMQNYERAFDFYDKAVELCPLDYAPPHLGIAQMYVRRGQLDKAEHSLRTLLKMLPQQPQALRMLATLYAQEESPTMLDTAIQLYNNALKFSSVRDDYDTWLGLAGTYERKQLWQQAIDSYEQAISIHQRAPNKNRQVPIVWLNNIAALQMHANLPKAALQTLDDALASRPVSTQDHYETNLLTVRFNRARVLEELHLDDQAELSYKELIGEYPHYYDSYLRLGVLAYKQNHCIAAMGYFKAVLKMDSDNVAARTYLGNYYTKQGELLDAMYNYNVILRRPDNFGDSYMLVAVGNVCLIKVERAMAEGDPERAKKYQENALQLFRKALAQNQRNLWAANGIGVALSNLGHLADGEAIFKQILESSKRCTDAILNTAHIALQLTQYKKAIKTYTQCMKDFIPVNTVKVMQLLASSLFQAGRLQDAKNWLLKARHVAPQDVSLLNNLSVIIQTELAELQQLEPELQSFLQFRGETEESVQSDNKQMKWVDKDRVHPISQENILDMQIAAEITNKKKLSKRKHTHTLTAPEDSPKVENKTKKKP